MKTTPAVIILASLIVGGAIVLSRTNSTPGLDDTASVDNVRVADGVQYIDITARGGYLPRHKCKIGHKNRAEGCNSEYVRLFGGARYSRRRFPRNIAPERN